MRMHDYKFLRSVKWLSLLLTGCVGLYVCVLFADENLANTQNDAPIAENSENASTITPDQKIAETVAPEAQQSLQKPVAAEPIAQTVPPTTQNIPVETKALETPAQQPVNHDPIAQNTPSPPAKPKTVLINFNNVAITEYIRFISRITNKNFVFDEHDLQFNVTIVSEEPTTIENIMSALMQELRIHGLSLLEEGNNLIIHHNPAVNSISRVVADGAEADSFKQSELVTRLFRLNTVDPDKAASILKPLVSSSAIVEVFKDTNYVIVTDIASNIAQISKLLKSIDAPNSGLVIGQFVVRNGYIDTLIELAQKIMQPIAQEQPLTFVPHRASNSIFVVSNPFLMERILSILQYLDQNQGTTRIFDLKELKFTPEGALIAPGAAAEVGGNIVVPGGTGSGWQIDLDGNWIYRPVQKPGVPQGTTPPEGLWSTDEHGNWRFEIGAKSLTPGEAPGVTVGPEGNWKLDSQGIWVFQLSPGKSISSTRVTIPPSGWHLDVEGNWIYRLGQQPGVTATTPPQGQWYADANGNWRFEVGVKPLIPGGAAGAAVGPEGQWKLDSQGIWVFQLAKGKSISAERVNVPRRGTAELPAGHIERTQFYIYKLFFRRGDQIQQALAKIGASLQISAFANGELTAAINSIQWIEASNSLIFTGSADTIEKMRQLIAEIDVPLRQIFLEMLILDTTVDDSMQYGVNWGTRFGGANTAGSQAFLSTGSPLSIGLSTTGPNSIPSATSLALTPGFNQGIIGQSLRHGGLTFSSIGALVHALHSRTDTNVLLNPKILVEDNVTAEIFVGINTQFPTQAITNDQGVIITQNFEFRDVGTRLRVTPQISDSGLITLTIEEEVSNVTTNPFGAGGSGSVGGGGNGSVGVIGPTTSRSNTKTRIHLPDGYFLVMSGIIQDVDTRTRDQVPCVGGIPFIGAAFSDKTHNDNKRNLLIFVRPKIIETTEEIDDITRHQQDIFWYKGKSKKMWQYETDEMLDFLNLPRCSDDPCREEACDPCDHSADRP